MLDALHEARALHGTGATGSAGSISSPLTSAGNLAGVSHVIVRTEQQALTIAMTTGLSYMQDPATSAWSTPGFLSVQLLSSRSSFSDADGYKTPPEYYAAATDDSSFYSELARVANMERSKATIIKELQEHPPDRDKLSSEHASLLEAYARNLKQLADTDTRFLYNRGTRLIIRRAVQHAHHFWEEHIPHEYFHHDNPMPSTILN